MEGGRHEDHPGNELSLKSRIWRPRGASRTLGRRSRRPCPCRGETSRAVTWTCAPVGISIPCGPLNGAAQRSPLLYSPLECAGVDGSSGHIASISSLSFSNVSHSVTRRRSVVPCRMLSLPRRTRCGRKTKTIDRTGTSFLAQGLWYLCRGRITPVVPSGPFRLLTPIPKLKKEPTPSLKI